MGLNVSKGNMYDFVNFTWNTVKGECPHNCSYCFCKRWGKQSALHFDKRELKTDLGEGNFIFVGSSCDMFAIDIPADWILETLKKCILSQGNKYLFQSKNPGGFLSLQRAGFWHPTICTTIETNRWYPEVMRNSPKPEERAEGMEAITPYDRYVTIEPIMDFDLEPMVELIKRCEPVQVNVGADSGNNHLPEPTAMQIGRLIEELEKFTRVKRKKNLGRILL